MRILGNIRRFYVQRQRVDIESEVAGQSSYTSIVATQKRKTLKQQF